MAAGAPTPSSKQEALEVTARAVRDAQCRDRDDLLAAQRRLRRAQKLGDGDREGVGEARRLLGTLADLVENGEAVLDMAPAVNAGHDGVVVATDRRLIFVALRRRLSQPYRQMTAVAVSGRRFRSRLIVSTPEARVVIAGLTPRRAAAFATLIRAEQVRGS
jgi:hypothetical protein